MKQNIGPKNKALRTTFGLGFIFLGILAIDYNWLLMVALMAIGFLTFFEGIAGYCVVHARRKTSDKR